MEIDKLRRWHTDCQIASSNGIEPAHWTYDRPERPVLDKARDAVAMLVSCMNLTETAMHYADCDEDGSQEKQVAREAAQLARQYVDELLEMMR
jgi:hypothetical protein